MKRTAFLVAAIALVMMVPACESTDTDVDSGGVGDVIGDVAGQDVENPADSVDDSGSPLDVGGDCLACEDTAVDDAINQDTGPMDDGAGGDAVGDDSGPISPDKLHPMFDFVGEVVLEKLFYAGGERGSYISAIFRDSIGARAHYLNETIGDCELWYAIGLPECEDPCDTDQYCDFDGECRDYYERIGAGNVKIEGLAETWTLAPDESYWYNSPPALPGELFKVGDQIVVSADGDAVPAFEVSINGTGDMTADWLTGQVEMIDGQDIVLNWDVKNDGATVELAFQSGWHGAPPTAIIYCSAPESQGSFTVDSYLIENFPPMGGIGLFPHESWIRRVNREVLDAPAGPVAVEARANSNFSFTHNAW